MIKVSVLYPKTTNSSFDMEYYRSTHMPMVKQKLGDTCKDVRIELGLAGGAPGQGPVYAAMGHLYFDSVDAFQGAFGPHAEVIMADIGNFTNVDPIVQISDVIQ